MDKGCNLKCSDVKDFNKDTLFKKCNFRKNDDFSKRSTWKMRMIILFLICKNKGRANSENKYDLPPPLIKIYTMELYY